MIRLRYCKIRIFHLLLPLMTIGIIGLNPVSINAGENHTPCVIVIDPGHGGNDIGATGSENHVEKTAALGLSMKIKEHLADAYTVHLTRTDDYDMNCFDRISTANHLKADVYISIHAGGAFLRQTNGATIFYFDDGGKSSGESPDTSPVMPSNGENPVIWDDIQYRHLARGKKLAETIGSVLAEKINPVRVQSAPLITLRGADMPAVMIEFGYITNPIDENFLFDQNRMDEYGELVRKAIDRFLDGHLNPSF